MIREPEVRMIRKLAILYSLSLFCLSGSLYAIERSQPDSPDRAKIEKGGSATVDASSRNRLTLSPQNRSVKDLKAEATADGGSKVYLEGRFQHALILKIAPDGSRTVECVDDHLEERALLEPEQVTSSPDDDSRGE